MGNLVTLPVTYHANQSKIFFESKARYKVVAKGRRWGYTRGLANFSIEQMLDGVSPILWVDTVNSNLDRYISRYFMPVLRHLPRDMWQYRQQRKELVINGSVMDLRSADRPENLEGFGYQLILLNEAGIILKDRYLWENAIRPMAMDYKANIIIGGTPKGKRHKGEKHLFYELYERAQKNESGEWQAFNFSSYTNPFIAKSEIDELVRETSAAVRKQEIFGEFTDSQGTGILRREWWKYYTELPPVINRIVQSWDTAFKKNEENDFSVCGTYAETPLGFYMLDLWRGRVEFPELKRVAQSLYQKWNPAVVLIEDKASGQSLIQELRTTSLPVIGVPVENDKIARAHSVAPTTESGRVFLPDNAPWVHDFVNELEDFPNGEHDDQVDQFSQAITYMKTSAATLKVATSGTRKSHSITAGY